MQNVANNILLVSNSHRVLTAQIKQGRDRRRPWGNGGHGLDGVCETRCSKHLLSSSEMGQDSSSVCL